ncbi:MAG: hypothetical protein ACR2QH_04225 [Geminicoccaceae bacterium]
MLAETRLHQCRFFLSLPSLAVLFTILCLPAKGVNAQDVNDEIRRATELAISNSIGEALSESLERSVSIREAITDATDTFYSQGAYGWIAEGNDGFGGGSNFDFDVYSYRALGGNTFRLTDRLFGGFALSATNVTSEVEFDVLGQSNSVETTFNFYTLAGNGSYFLAKGDRNRMWVNGLYQFTYVDLDSDLVDDSYSNSVSPSLNYAIDFQPMTVELGAGINYSTNSESDEAYTNNQASVKLKTDIGNFVPQLLVSLSSDLGSLTEEGSLTIRPEINYLRKNLAFGIGYSNTRQTEDDIIRSNEAFANLRWRF